MVSLELQKFYQTLQNEISASQLGNEEGASQEQLFTEFACSLLAEAGETENYRLAYDEKVSKKGIQHKINAYAESENNETLDLFISIFHGTDAIASVTKEPAERAKSRISSFFKTGIYGEYIKDIEESSEIFELINRMSSSQELREGLVRVNAFILTDGIFNSTISLTDTISGYPVYYRVIDLNYLYNISEKSHIPIEIKFKEDGFEIPCIASPAETDQYKSYLAIFPGNALANIYERFGSRLLEQNIRSFLQNTGKVNKGIRNTILTEPHMFLAFNNGIAATADSIVLSEDGTRIESVNDLQIVNGGQTTASIFHTWKKDKADVSRIFVQVKLNVVKEKDKFSEIVSRIAEYANTQNKVTVSDLGSNQPFHIEMEKLSRTIWAPPLEGSNQQTRWFYERARGQYKNARAKEGFTKAKQAAFDLKNPRNQLFTKEDLAKFSNAFCEITEGKKVINGPHIVVRGNQKNYSHFMGLGLPKKLDNIYFEDVVAKMILYKAAEKRYGVKPNAIGDMRYITVPYSIAYFNFCTGNKLDLYKIWKAQAISEALKDCLYHLMVEVEKFIKENATGSLYGEFAKKEECWTLLKESNIPIQKEAIKNDFASEKSTGNRVRLSQEDSVKTEREQQIAYLMSVSPNVWKHIENWGRATGHLTARQQDMAFNLASRVRNNGRGLSDSERESGIRIMDFVVAKFPEVLENFSESEPESSPKEQIQITHELIKAVVAWDKKAKRLTDFEYKFMADLASGAQPLTDNNIKKANWNYLKAKKFGFSLN
jgi:hypothetical protein